MKKIVFKYLIKIFRGVAVTQLYADSQLKVSTRLEPHAVKKGKNALSIFCLEQRS